MRAPPRHPGGDRTGVRHLRGRPARATLTSVEPHTEEIGAADLAEALAALDWPEADLDPAFPPAIAYAGARHLVIGARTRARLAGLAYDFARLEALMRRLDLTTVQLVHRAGPAEFHVRDPFPVGGVVEDPATEPPRPPSARTPASAAWSRRTRSSRSTRARTWAGPGSSRWNCAKATRGCG